MYLMLIKKKHKNNNNSEFYQKTKLEYRNNNPASKVFKCWRLNIDWRASKPVEDNSANKGMENRGCFILAPSDTLVC